MTLNEQVRQFWESEICGTNPDLIGQAPMHTLEWYEAIERHRYTVEPFIHTVAQFPSANGKKVLEIGVGAGTDHLQWARAGAECYGVDLTDAAIEATRQRLALYGLSSQLQRTDAEHLPFEDNTFDIVYSWGVIHHSERPQAIIAEIHRVLKQGGTFNGMMYHRPSLVSWELWLKYGLLRGKPFRSLKDVIWNHMESVGTKAYTVSELRTLFSAFREFKGTPILTTYDTRHIPNAVKGFIPQNWGFFVGLNVTK
jgi:ubiquinone/menaquinone biosynthesis C-methylase UbiE